MVTILEISEWPAHEIEPLVLESEQEGFRFLKRLREDWISGVNRFSLKGEALFGAFDQDRLLAVGGINRESHQRGRLRRFYVKPTARRKGIGRLLVQHILQHASPHFDQVILFTDTKAADQFYVTLGFVPISNQEGSSHMIKLPLSPAD